VQRASRTIGAFARSAFATPIRVGLDSKKSPGFLRGRGLSWTAAFCVAHKVFLNSDNRSTLCAPLECPCESGQTYARAQNLGGRPSYGPFRAGRNASNWELRSELLASCSPRT